MDKRSGSQTVGRDPLGVEQPFRQGHGYPVYQIFIVRFIAVAKLQV